MAVFEEIHVHNHKLVELSSVLMYLLRERAMCDTETANSLLFDTMKKIDEHLNMVDHLYQELLSDKDQKMQNTAQLFISGERELKRIIAQYKKAWFTPHRQSLRVSDHEQFCKDTSELFDIVLSRIEDETEHLYPLIREVQAGKSAA